MVDKLYSDRYTVHRLIVQHLRSANSNSEKNLFSFFCLSNLFSRKLGFTKFSVKNANFDENYKNYQNISGFFSVVEVII